MLSVDWIVLQRFVFRYYFSSINRSSQKIFSQGDNQTERLVCIDFRVKALLLYDELCIIVSMIHYASNVNSIALYLCFFQHGKKYP